MTPIPKEVLEAMVEAGANARAMLGTVRSHVRESGVVIPWIDDPTMEEWSIIKAALSAAASLGYTLNNGEK